MVLGVEFIQCILNSCVTDIQYFAYI